MSRELDDPDYDVEINMVNGRLSFGPNTHPAELVRWVAACFLHPERVMTDETGETWTGQQIVDRYLTDAHETVIGTSHAELHAEVMARWGGR